MVTRYEAHNEELMLNNCILVTFVYHLSFGYPEGRVNRWVTKRFSRFITSRIIIKLPGGHNMLGVTGNQITDYGEILLLVHIMY